MKNSVSSSMRQFLFWGLISCSMAGGLCAGSAPVAANGLSFQPAPAGYADDWEWTFETGVLWRVGNNGTPLDYTLLPQILYVRAPYQFQFSPQLFVRSRFNLLAEPIIEGPESYFFGLSAGPSLEWYSANNRDSFFFSPGGGVGLLDSQGQSVEGGQGQDFNFTWYLHAGWRRHWTPRLTTTVGVYFQHISNTGLDDINPGLDALGPTLGLSWKF